MTEIQKKELWQTAEIFRGTKASGNINDIARVVCKEQLKDSIKPEYQNTEFIKNVKADWQSSAPDDSVEYVTGKFEIDRDKLVVSDYFGLNLPYSFIDYNDGRSIFINIIPRPLDSETVVNFDIFGGIRYFRDGNANSITLAEQYIENYFSVARLLQMKVWWDEIPHVNTPKLAAVYQWTADTTNAAIAGQISFTVPPYTFEEITQEIVSLS